MRYFFFTFFILITHLGLAQLQNFWLQRDSINGAPRSVSSAFVLQGDGYSIAGLDYAGFRRKMYSYSLFQDDWDSEESIGGVNGAGLNRGSASAFAINDKGYVCLGQGVTNPFFKDLWEFDPVMNTWEQKADFIGSPRRQCVGFAIDSLAYVGTGIDATGLKKDMYKYSPATNTWTQLNDFGGTARKEAVGFTMGGQGYVGTGDDGVMKNDFWQYEPTLDSWVQKADFPGTPRKGAVGWGVFPQAFICTGDDINFNYTNDLWEFNYFSNSWVQRADFIGEGRTGAIAFVLQDIAFIGSGYNGTFFDDLFSYNRVLDVAENDPYANIIIYPNPASNSFKIDVDSKELELEVYSLDGKDITSQFIIAKTFDGFDVNISAAPSGNYIVSLLNSSLGRVFQDKLIVL